MRTSSPRPDDTREPILIMLDGTCIFCNRLVAFILRRDREDVFRFTHLQGATASQILDRHNLAPDIDTIYAVTGFGTQHERVHCDGEAGRLIWPRLFPFAIVLRWVPLFWLNMHYRLFARIRYRLFGQADTCIAPAPHERARFFE